MDIPAQLLHKNKTDTSDKKKVDGFFHVVVAVKMLRRWSKQQQIMTERKSISSLVRLASGFTDISSWPLH